MTELLFRFWVKRERQDREHHAVLTKAALERKLNGFVERGWPERNPFASIQVLLSGFFEIGR